MARPLTRAQTMENAAFIKALRRTGNIRMAAREVGVAPATLHTRRATHPAFAQQWNVAVVMANARFHEQGGRKGPGAALDEKREPQAAHRTRGGEPVVVRCRDGRLQMRAAQPGKLTIACEQAFLSALSSTANVRLSAAAAGASVAAFYRRRRDNPAFAREMRLALQRGYEQIELALLSGFEPSSYCDDSWRHNEPPPIPQMTVSQALQLLYLHQKEARLWGERPDRRRRRRGETADERAGRLWAKWTAEKAWDREGYAVMRAAQAEGPAESPHEPPPPALPALDQVSGWSKADPAKVPHHPDRALFGGWRLEDLEKRRRKG